MALVTLEEAKTYLRVDTTDDDTLISSLLLTSEVLTKDIGRVSDEVWTVVNATPTAEDPQNIKDLRSVLKVGELYALAYLYDHREEADHHDLVITMRNLLFAVREGVI